MTAAEKKARSTKAQTLQVTPMADEIRRHETSGDLLAGAWLVTCESDPDLRHMVRFDGQAIRWGCSCTDYRQHRADPGWICKHILAVQGGEGLLGRMPAPKGRAPQEKPLIDFLAPKPPPPPIPLSPFAQRALDTYRAGTWKGQGTVAEALPQDDPQPAVEMALAGEEEIPQGPSEPLDPCMECGQLLPGSEMRPHQNAEGSGLICWACAEEEAQSLGECSRAAAQERLARDMAPKPQAIPTLAERIAGANEVLASFGPIAIETDQKGYTGYGAQYVIDAVNQALGFDGWKYDLVDHQTEKAGEKAHRAMVLLQLSIRMDDGSWFCRGPVVGGSTNSDGADALKGAITDGLKKAFSQWSIGNLAYRGELKATGHNK